MAHPISMLMFIATLVMAAGCYGVYAGLAKDRYFGPLTGRRAQIFGFAHVIVAVWMVYGAATNNTELKFGACLMIGKSKNCSWTSSV